MRKTRHFHYSANKAFTMVEILLVIALFGIIAGLVTSHYKEQHDQVVLDTVTSTIMLELERAHSDALAGLGGEVQSVRISSTTVTRFGGATYDPYASDLVVFSVDPSVILSSSLPSDGVVTFARLTGETGLNATITAALIDDVTKYQQVVIGSRGDVMMVSE